MCMSETNSATINRQALARGRPTRSVFFLYLDWMENIFARYELLIESFCVYLHVEKYMNVAIIIVVY